MTNAALAFLMGLVGSLHCVTMCGPLVMSMPLLENRWWLNLVQKLVYQFGRILTYAAFGFSAGLIGSSFNILGIQQLLSLTTGLLLITIAIFHFSAKKISRINRFTIRIVNPLAVRMGKLLSKPYGSLFAGSLHGLLPCGMVYMAIAGSLNTGSPSAGSTFMFFFGLGTTPLLLLASLLPVFLRRFRTPKLMIPALFLLTGLILIARSFNPETSHSSSHLMMNHSTHVPK